MPTTAILNPEPPVSTKGNKRVAPEAVHGGFRDNVHYNAYEAMCADETGMGRDILRRTDGISDEEAQVRGGIDEFMSAQPNKNVGPDSIRSSKWSAKK